MLAYRTCLFDQRPHLGDISSDGGGSYQFYPGQWYWKKAPSVAGLTDGRNGLTLPLGQEIAAATRRSTSGLTPLIDATQGFYIEFEVKLSSNDADHWPALWLMPIEHDGAHRDQDPNGPQGSERWVEIDVDEGGFGRGTHGVAIEWSGSWPNYAPTISPHGTSGEVLDRSRFHRYGFSYDPVDHLAIWWIDGKRGHQSSINWMPRFHFYPIVGAQSHGRNVDYSLTLRRLVAFVPRVSK